MKHDPLVRKLAHLETASVRQHVQNKIKILNSVTRRQTPYNYFCQ
jgi:hypothetical protein